jgi:hypothetical protein
MSTAVQIDSLIANEYRVELNGETVNGVFRVSNLQTYATDGEGNRLKPPFVVAKMVQRDGNLPMNQWLRDTMAARDSGEAVTRDLTILAVDDGVVTRRWIVRGARIINVAYSDFDSSTSIMVEESLTIAYDDIEEEWPAM